MECMREKFYDGVVLDGRFQALSPLNHGSFGMVFMAKDLTTDNLVAIKCLTKKTAATEADSSFAIDEKSEELACHARLGNHPNIVNLIYSFETDAHTYLVLEYCSKGDLYEAIRTGCGPLTTEHVREFMLQLVDAVAYIHEKGMYHRDIKPENIFLTEDGVLKLGDFGLATKDTWSYETTVGSDRYMAPEQYDSAGSGYSPAQADIWAIGICLLNVLFSRNPFSTPTEADPLFLDFSRDKQSLFDVFPTMSQDTFEVIANCMSLDPKKRSLSGAREALLRAVTFTTFDELPDEFLNSRPTTAIAANREPLRTPSVQSPHIEQGSFPWAKHLQASQPQAIRQLSAIADTESYTEDLFPRSEDSNNDWFSMGVQTPSTSLGASLKSLAIKRPMLKSFPRADLTPISGSLPITMAMPKIQPSMSMVFGKRDLVSKSWSDLYDEDFEEEETRARQFRERQEQNARTWSHESKNEDVTIHQPAVVEPSSPTFVNIRSKHTTAGQAAVNDIDSDHVIDGFFFHDSPARQYSPPRYSPPNKRAAPFDKWAALGDRRRAATLAGAGKGAGVGSTTTSKVMGTGTTTTTSPEFWRGRRNTGYSSTGFGAGVWDKDRVNHHINWGPRESPWGVRDRDRELRKEKDVGDLEWVGGWHDFA